VRYDPDTRVLSMPRGTVLDLGATAKAHAADLVAERCAQRLPGGFLINFGGDIAVSGPPPDGGWDVGVEDANGDVCQVVVSTGQAIATSSTSRRSWMGSGGRRHHIIDPRTGESAEVVWTQVTCAGVTALEANAASTAGVILGERAPQWLTDRGVPARLERAAGQVVVTPGWPDPEERAA
jgi:thiamine biosynthesis lipoprotein